VYVKKKLKIISRLRNEVRLNQPNSSQLLFDML